MYVCRPGCEWGEKTGKLEPKTKRSAHGQGRGSLAHSGHKSARLPAPLWGGRIAPMAARFSVTLFCLAIVGCDGYRATIITMRAKQAAVSRRDLAKQFYDPDGWRRKLPPGWSPALVVSLGSRLR